MSLVAATATHKGARATIAPMPQQIYAAGAMDEILPGVFHWTTFHDGIGPEVHSHYAAGARALIDPMVPGEGLGWFEGERRPEVILLTNRHHYRHSDRFVDAFGCTVLCHEEGLHEFAPDGPDVRPFVRSEEHTSEL